MLLRLIVLLAMVSAAVLGLVLGIFESIGWLWAYPLLVLGFVLLGLAVAFLYLLILCKQVDPDVEQEVDDPHYRKVMELYLDSLLPLVRVSVRTTGRDKLPKGRFMLVCNHCSNADPIILLRELSGCQISFISKKENRDMFVIGPMMHKLLCQMIDRNNDREALKTIIKCVRLLQEDKVSVGVFPEGGISKPDRKLHRFRPGVFKIAQKAKVPIVVCTLKNTKYVIPNLLKLRPTRVELDIVAVLEPEEVASGSTTQLAEKAYALMARNLGPENVAEDTP